MTTSSRAPVDVIRIVSRRDVDAERLEIAGRAGIRVAPGHGDAAPSEQLGERAHSRARDADEVNGARDRSYRSAACRGRLELRSLLELLARDGSKNVRARYPPRPSVERAPAPCALIARELAGARSSVELTACRE